MRKMLIAGALILAFSCPAFAGEIHTPAIAAPDTRESQLAGGYMQTGLTETLLSVLDSVLALF